MQQISAPSRVQVALASRSYDIIIGPNLLAQAGEFIAPILRAPRVIIISDDNVAPLYLQALQASLTAQNIRHESLIVPAGEGSKSFSQLQILLEQILALNPDRNTALLALGGGVVGDLVGFAASIILRGIDFIQVPTSLLAQVDSSVGGKTGINSSYGKNLIGSFYQPKLVLADLSVLASLPARQMRAGYAEIIKYGLIMNADFYRWCLQNGADLLAYNLDILQYAVMQCCAMKAQIVGRDEREAAARALLNFGHTFGHALEAETGYGEALLHGEAVAIGMVMACRMAQKMGLLDSKIEAELRAHFIALGLPTSPLNIENNWQAQKIAAHFVQDKKAENGELTFVLLQELGAAIVKKQVGADLALAVVQEFIGEI